MLRLASFPPDRHEIEKWFVYHQREWSAGEAYRFAVEHNGTMVGIVDIDEIAEGEGTLGYWLDRAVWGRGYAFEAAHAVTRFAFQVIGLSKLSSEHAVDNPASGRVLLKLGFAPLDVVTRFSRPRGASILQHRYMLSSLPD